MDQISVSAARELISEHNKIVKKVFKAVLSGDTHAILAQEQIPNLIKISNGDLSKLLCFTSVVTDRGNVIIRV